MDSMTDFAVCGFCGKTVYIERITAPPKWKPAELRDTIRRKGAGLGVCPDCGKPSRFVLRGIYLELKAAQEREGVAAEAPQEGEKAS